MTQQQTKTNNQKKIMKVTGSTLIIIALLFIGTMANAQSPFKSIPKVVTHVNPFAHAAVAAPDSLLKAWRFIADIVAYSEPGNIAMAGMGYGYQSLKWDYTNSKWNCQWSVSAVAFAGGSVVPSTPASIMSAGLMVGLLNNTVMAGPVYNFGTKQFGVALSIGISLNN